MLTVCKRDSRRNTKLSLTPKGCGAHGCGMWIVFCHIFVSILTDKWCKNTIFYYQSNAFREKFVIKSKLFFISSRFL